MNEALKSLQRLEKCCEFLNESFETHLAIKKDVEILRDFINSKNQNNGIEEN